MANVVKIEHDQTSQVTGHSPFGMFKKKYVILASIIFVLVLIVLISLIVTLSTIPGKCETNEIVNASIKVSALPQNQELTDQDTKTNLNQHFQVIPRRAWLAQPPVEEPNKLHLPVPYVIILHTTTNQCKDQADCIMTVRYIQTFSIESNGWWDIGYNFLIGGDGFAYEGRGWKSEGAHTYAYNSRSIGIAFIGTYNTVLPTQAQMTACKQLIEQGVENGVIDKDYKLLGARQVSNTKSPGSALYEEIKKWPHWSASP